MIVCDAQAMMSMQVDIGLTCESSFTDSRGEDGRKTEGFYLIEGLRLLSIHGDGGHGAAAASGVVVGCSVARFSRLLW